MGTNFYAKIIPTNERKKELHDAIEADDFRLIENITAEMYGPIKLDYDDGCITGGVVHLGKRSRGWKFLWNPNVFVVRNGHSEKIELESNHYRYKWVEEPDTAEYLYPLTKEGIKAFIDREDVLIYDEYDELLDKETFWKEALEWVTWGDKEAYDGGTYDRDHPTENHRWINDTELTRLLEREGFTFTSKTRSDFYSDGLRFSTSTEFS